MNDFTEQEIRQVIKLWEINMSAGYKVDRRAVSSRNVQQWAVSRGLCVWTCQHSRTYDGYGMPPWSCVQLDEPMARGKECRWTLRIRKSGDLYRSGYRRFNSERDLPVEILWHYIRDFIYHDGTTSPRGFSINLHKDWLRLNIYPEGSRYDPKDQHFDFRFTCLDRLHRAGYIILQTAGSVWQITILERGRKNEQTETQRSAAPRTIV